jgi:hypothetical protein
MINRMQEILFNIHITKRKREKVITCTKGEVVFYSFEFFLTHLHAACAGLDPSLDRKDEKGEYISPLLSF